MQQPPKRLHLPTSAGSYLIEFVRSNLVSILAMGFIMTLGATTVGIVAVAYKPTTAKTPPVAPTPAAQVLSSTDQPAATVAAALATPTPTPVIKKLIDCVGPDGKHAMASKTDCDNLNNVWKTHTPQASTNTGGGSTNPQPSNSGSNSNPSIPAIPTPTPTPTNNISGTITISTTSVNITLSRANAQYSLVYGSGFTITSQGATGWEIHYNEGTSGQGFYESSGGISPGNSTNIRSYINANKANGTYSGSAVVEYYKDGSWQSGPTVSYSITLTD